MGCDIHIVLERKHNDHWVGLREMTWLSVPTLEIMYPQGVEEPKSPPMLVGHRLRERDYSFFYAIAQVRGYDGDTGGLEPRGAPEDISTLGQMLFDNWDSDGHSHSWLFMSELKPILQRLKEPEETTNAVVAVLEGSETKSILNRWVDDYIGTDDGEGTTNIDDWRIVFCFDN